MATEVADGGVVICDEWEQPVLRLNRPAAVVWRHCDGTHGIAALAAIVRLQLGQGDQEQVLLALDDLARHGLIESGYEPRDARASRISRRDFIRAAGAVAVAAVGLPVVNSLVNPTPAAACGPGYTYVYGQPQAPVVTHVHPSIGPSTGGTQVTIEGRYFHQGAVVRFGSVVASEVTVVNSTEIVAVAPAGAGPVDVTVSTSVGISAKGHPNFSYSPAGQSHH